MKITNFKAIYICPDHNEKYQLRRLHMEELLKTVGFKIFEHYKSSSQNYPGCLCDATIDILKNNLDEPIIIFEDDVDWTGIADIEYTADCDAIYLGISKSGGHPTENIHLGHSIFEPWSDTQVRVKNMLSAHAILYNSKKYKEAVINSLINRNNHVYYNDVLMARLQPEFLILANKKPLFFQSSKFNIPFLEEHTRFEIEL